MKIDRHFSKPLRANWCLVLSL